MTLEEFEDKFKKQNYQCDACKATESGSKRNWHIDHDHETGKIRGILCSGCNIALGNLKDDPNRIIQLYNYIQRYHNG